jgi:hypothetical protein
LLQPLTPIGVIALGRDFTGFLMKESAVSRMNQHERLLCML